MKKLFYFCLTFFYLQISFAQTQFGLKGGINLADTRFIIENSRARVGWNAGLLAEVPIQEDIFIKPELQYSSKGFGFPATRAGRSGIVKLNYIAIPVLFGYRFNPKASIVAGPEFGFLRKAVSKSQNITNDMTDFYRHFDVGVDLGFAYNITKVFGAEARYNYGFKDLVNVAVINENGNVSGQGKNGANSVLQLGVFYMFQ